MPLFYRIRFDFWLLTFDFLSFLFKILDKILNKKEDAWLLLEQYLWKSYLGRATWSAHFWNSAMQ